MSGRVVVLSGGLDSTVCMALAAQEDTPPVAVTFDYGQRHSIELTRAEAVARHFSAEHLVVQLDARSWGGSALTDDSLAVPSASAPDRSSGPDIPVTYVPARNIIFLAVALGIAEARDADAVSIGVNALDYSGYPDCRPEFIAAFGEVARVGQRRGVEGRPVAIEAPLIGMTKSDIVALGTRLGAPFELTWSCYREGPSPCGDCDACSLRAKGFAEAGVVDPTLAGP